MVSLLILVTQNGLVLFYTKERSCPPREGILPTLRMPWSHSESILLCEQESKTGPMCLSQMINNAHRAALRLKKKQAGQEGGLGQFVNCKVWGKSGPYGAGLYPVPQI
ncbi:glycosyltransferase, CAZy GT29 [Datura stramonium]|uniref:Glycosyltransferase, CAZy GT29 n=1 Tax=Datura stramonium TaxID=4076 RepID=A0ABS8SQC7_DATST|nr:glycosyltransferase, CAZy GT29 [Datura stramonium]